LRTLKLVIKTTNIASNLIRGCLARHTSKAIPRFYLSSYGCLIIKKRKKKEKEKKEKEKKG